ncbi:MAG: tyrosine-type recombinase/integrase [Pseudomonadota bacterium]
MDERQRLRIDIELARFVDAMGSWNWSRRTIVSYEQNVRHFFDWLSAETEIDELTEVTPETLATYQTGLLVEEKRDGERISIGTHCNRLAAVKGFFRHLWREGRLLMNPASQIQYPKTQRHLPRSNLTPKEAVGLIESIDTSEPLGKRDRAMLEVLYGTGMRNAELRGLCMTDIGEKTLTVRCGKGGKDRVVPLGKITWDALSDYVQQERPWLAKRDGVQNLFLTRNGRALAAPVVIKAVKMAARRAGLKKHLHPHLLRHACATHMLKGGADIRHIQRLLGHASLQTTEIYTKVEIGDLKTVHRLYHPRERHRAGGRA